MSSGPENNTENEKVSKWQKAVDGMALVAEGCNGGIVLQAAGQWVPEIAAVFAAPPLSYFITIPEPSIYFFRALIALTKAIGRTFFGVKFREEKIKSHPYQVVGDLICLACFSLSIVAFAGALVAPPLALPVAWLLGLAGMACSSYFNYIWPEKQAKKKFDALVDQGAPEGKLLDAYREYKEEKISRLGYMFLIGGLSVLLICGSLAALAAPLVKAILTVVSNTASVFLVGLAAVRYRHWRQTRQSKKMEANNSPKPEEQELTAIKKPAAHANDQLKQVHQIFSAASKGRSKEKDRSAPVPESPKGSVETEKSQGTHQKPRSYSDPLPSVFFNNQDFSRPQGTSTNAAESDIAYKQ